jgi:hypothetical protein
MIDLDNLVSGKPLRVRAAAFRGKPPMNRIGEK